MKKTLIVGTISVLALGGVGAAVLLQPEQIKLENAQKIQWEKPTTDEEWAEDVKKENFDIKSTGRLREMIESHTEKLSIQQNAFSKFVEMEKRGEDPVAYLYWDYREILINAYPKMDELEIDAEARKAAQDDYDRQLWEIEKLKQSIERMNKEVELREKGFVEVEGETKKFGGIGSVPPERIRHIND